MNVITSVSLLLLLLYMGSSLSDFLTFLTKVKVLPMPHILHIVFYEYLDLINTFPAYIIQIGHAPSCHVPMP